MKFSRFLDWVIISIGFISTVLVTIYVYDKNYQEDAIRFQYETEIVLRRIQSRMQSYEGTLIQLRAFLKNSTEFNRHLIQNYIQDTEIFERFPGLQGLGYSTIFGKEELLHHIRAMRKFVPGYKLYPEGERDLYSAIIVLEPEDRRNKKAIGYDMFSERVRRAAMAEAGDSGNATLSDLLYLVQEDENEKKPGFNLYLPFYEKNTDTSTVAGRRKGLLGFVYSPFRANDLFKALLKDEKILDIEVYAERISPETKYYDHVSEDGEQNLLAYNTLQIGGRNWIIKTSANRNFPLASSPLKTFLVFLLGSFVTILIYSIYLITRKQMHFARVMAQEKERLLQREKEHVAARDDFLSIASHELKTPLTSLKLQSQVMMRAIARKDPEALSEEKITNLVRQIDNQTTRLTRLVDDMLDISRIRTGRLKIVKEKVNLNEVIMDVIERLKPQFIKSIGETPELDLVPEVEGQWDRFRLEQVLTNLFTNAIRYGNGKPVKVKTEIKDKSTTIYVIDHGIGIAKENIDKIFERFERGGMSASEVSGLGLGLYITSQIVKAHGGTIKVESEVNKGSTFIVELPIE